MFSHKLTNKLGYEAIIFGGLANSSFHTSACCMEIQKMSRLRVVDNSEIGKRAMAEGKPPKCIHVYNKTGIGYIGTLISTSFIINSS